MLHGKTRIARTVTRPPTVGLLFLLAVLATYLPVLGGDLLWDDGTYVTAPDLRSAGGLWRIWTDSRATPQYYPLTHSAFWIQYRLWGLATPGYHVVSVLLHVTSALLLWRILARLAVPGALFAASIWALHPVQVESVARIAELKSTLSGVFFFAALLAYLSFDPPRAAGEAVRQEGVADDRDWRPYALAFTLFVAALLSKTATASLPAVLLLIFWWKEGRLDWRSRCLPLVPFFTLGLALWLTAAWLEHDALPTEDAAVRPGWLELGLVAGRAAWFYLGKLVWPANLLFIYPRWPVDTSAWWPYAYPTAAIVVVIALWALRDRLGRGPLVAALFFAGTGFAALGFFDVYLFNYSFVADRFQYLASAGVIALGAGLIATGLGRLGRWGRLAGVGACAVLVLALAGLSWRQTHVYADAETLFRDVAARNPGGVLAYSNLGTAYLQQRRYADAIRVYRGLIAMRPDFARAHVGLGLVHASQGRHGEAVALYETALRADPRFAEAHHYLGLSRYIRGQRDEAMDEYRAALAIRPDLTPASLSLGRALVDAGRHAEAVATLKAAVAAKPRLAEAHYVLGVAHGALGQGAEAVDAYKTAVALRPDYPEAYNNLGLEYRKSGQVAEAVSAYRSAIAARPDFAAAYNNLGAAYAHQAKYAEAAEAWQNALRFDPRGAVGRMARSNLESVRPLLAH
jgi:tetratricopeptide (TPR) repeat protein